jgi:hypothetical protein
MLAKIDSGPFCKRSWIGKGFFLVGEIGRYSLSERGLEVILLGLVSEILPELKLEYRPS